MLTSLLSTSTCILTQDVRAALLVYNHWPNHAATTARTLGKFHPQGTLQARIVQHAARPRSASLSIPPATVPLNAHPHLSMSERTLPQFLTSCATLRLPPQTWSTCPMVVKLLRIVWTLRDRSAFSYSSFPLRRLRSFLA